jgi:hypothetical protein
MPETSNFSKFAAMTDGFVVVATRATAPSHGGNEMISPPNPIMETM